MVLFSWLSRLFVNGFSKAAPTDDLFDESDLLGIGASDLFSGVCVFTKEPHPLDAKPAHHCVRKKT